MEGDDETLDKKKKKRYHKCYNNVDCRRCRMDRPTRSHVPLIELDGGKDITMKLFGFGLSIVSRIMSISLSNFMNR